MSEVLIYIVLHIIHEINIPSTFDGLKEKGINVHRPEHYQSKIIIHQQGLLLILKKSVTTP